MSLSNETTYGWFFLVNDIYFCSKFTNIVKFILNCNFILLPMANKSFNSYFMEHIFYSRWNLRATKGKLENIKLNLP